MALGRVGETPFARVLGVMVAMAEAPSSVSGQDYRVRLEAFEGPLDLLLYLVKRHEIDLHDIPVAQLTDQYMAQLEGIDALDVDRAGEFLVMASTLLQTKSAVLLPRPEEAEGGDEDESAESADPRYELVQQLLAYKRYKDAAEALETRYASWSQRAPAQAAVGEKEQSPDEAPKRDLELDDVNVFDLYQTFTRLLESVGTRNAGHEVVDDETPLSVHVERLASRIAEEGSLSLEGALSGGVNRAEMIGVFLAILELARQRRLRIHQDEPGGPVELALRPEAERPEPDEAPDWRDPETGEVVYDWPDEESKRRYERRLARQRQAGGKPEPADHADEAESVPDEEADDEGDADDPA